LQYALRIACEAYKRFLRPKTQLQACFGSKNKESWAVITGSSDGIGKEFALGLARRGFNTLLISRSKAKLDDVAKQISDRYKVRTKVVAADFGWEDRSFYNDIRLALEQCQPVAILVNNVGISFPHPSKFLDSEEELDNQIIDINIRTLNEMTRVVLPNMIKNKRGGIINVSSYSGVLPAAMLSTYSASKAYIHFFSQCLATEYKKDGIEVLSITPSLTVSNMSKLKKPSLTQAVAAPGVIAEGALAVLGKEIHWSPYWLHALIEYVTTRLPRWLMNKFLLSLGLSVRKRALAKQAREKQQS